MAVLNIKITWFTFFEDDCSTHFMMNGTNECLYFCLFVVEIDFLESSLVG